MMRVRRREEEAKTRYENAFFHSFVLPSLSSMHEKKNHEPSQKVTEEEEGERKGKSESKSDDAQKKITNRQYIPF
jgi:hypothetical protein